ncbi:MAG: two pore domain potassium channel family protein [Desulfomonile tiedjei]|nr:two pore domain potassium channel family protein [Desulfomonile tiedjei]
MVLVLFLGLLLLDPLIPGALTNLSFAAIGVAGAWLLSDRKSLSRKVIAVSSSAVVVALALGKLLPTAMVGPARMRIGLLLLTFTLILYASCGALMLSVMLKAREVSHRIIVSAVNLYIILGMFYAHIYTILDWFHPDSFALQFPDRESASHFVYFSFVTLATLGYGDITPKSEFAQRLAITEAIMGQFYGSLVVAYLLSVYIGQRIRVGDSGSTPERRSGNSARDL